MSNLFHVSAAPHARGPVTTGLIMKMVAIALLPTSLYGIYNFGIRALVVILVTVAACVATEYIYCKLMKKPVTTGDFSAVVTGLLLALNFPVSIPLWVAVLGAIFAVIMVKMLFGGIGQNFMNPALAARAFLLISFPERMTDFAVKAASGSSFKDYFLYGAMGVEKAASAAADAVTSVTQAASDVVTGATQAAADAVSGATPLAVLKEGESVDLLKMFIGGTGGTIGETSALALLIGAAFLLAIKVISLRIPLSYILTFVVFILLFGPDNMSFNYVMGQVLGGGLLLGAFFMATDYVTSPATRYGQIVFGILLGVFTGIFRIMGKSPEGVSYAIIFCNTLVPLIEKVTMPRSFGKERVRNAKQSS